jgi:hypothetical protein
MCRACLSLALRCAAHLLEVQRRLLSWPCMPGLHSALQRMLCNANCVCSQWSAV